MISSEQRTISHTVLQDKIDQSIQKVAPLWPLQRFVAVNPYMGVADMPFVRGLVYLEKTGGIRPALPISFYLEAFDDAKICKEDLQDALLEINAGVVEDADEFLNKCRQSRYQDHIGPVVLTVADIATRCSEKDWVRMMTDRISFWASAHFDENQAIWKTSDEDENLFRSWKREAETDLSTELMGLKGFRELIRSLPSDEQEVSRVVLESLDLTEAGLEHYLTALLLRMNGWAGIASRIDWDAGLYGKQSNKLKEFLAILLCWELAIKKLSGEEEIRSEWEVVRNTITELDRADEISETAARTLILQYSFDKANQRRLIESINTAESNENHREIPSVQAIFCIDVRSEVYRRHLEATREGIETMGFAGFFAFPIEYVRLAHKKGTSQCPVLLTPTHTIEEVLIEKGQTTEAVKKRTLAGHVKRAWHSFKLGAITCFSFVGPVGLAYLPKLFTDSFRRSRPFPHPDEAGLTSTMNATKTVSLETNHARADITGIPKEERVHMAAGALKAMSLTDDFARIVLITGHGASTVNNPHATGLDCGACGGHTGEANARVAAAILNDGQVRLGLKEQGIEVPDDTLFIAALHDTTTDEVRLLKDSTEWPETHDGDIAELITTLREASKRARCERAERMNIRSGDISTQVLERSRDWSQVRPEWGLAGCSSFIVAPRKRTKDLDLGGKAFMHSYDWTKDEGFGVLELIMTAPMVVTTWINLQYYASVVDNVKLGSGNKTLHNVVGGMGVLEGFTGDLRTGLPLQSVHDGDTYQHEPLRLNVFIEAPVDEMSKILSRHQSVKELVDNEWIFLFAINEDGKVSYRYSGDLQWEVI